jgi:hypothetical protein
MVIVMRANKNNIFINVILPKDKCINKKMNNFIKIFSTFLVVMMIYLIVKEK